MTRNLLVVSARELDIYDTVNAMTTTTAVEITTSDSQNFQNDDECLRQNARERDVSLEKTPSFGDQILFWYREDKFVLHCATPYHQSTQYKAKLFQRRSG